MSTEKTIRLQAKTALKGNWIQIIVSAITVCVAMLIYIYAVGGVQFAFGCYNENTGELIESKKLLSFIISTSGMLFLLLVSPFVNGLFRQLYRIAFGGEADITDCTYYFRHKYTRTVFLNLVLAIIYLVVSTVFDFELWTSLLLEVNGMSNSSADVVLVIAGIVTAVVDIIIALILLLYPLFAYASDDELGIGGSLSAIGLGFRCFGKSFKLTVSFIGWLLLCFFVVPAFYVVPYLMTSYAVSAKWMLQINRNKF